MSNRFMRPVGTNKHGEITFGKSSESRSFTLTTITHIPKPVAEVFPFFAHAENLELITPPWLNFHILDQTAPEMFAGKRINYKLRLRGIPLRWQSEIVFWDPPAAFTDEQRWGPYRRWHHEHRFHEFDGHTEMTDYVEYQVPGGALVNKLYVEHELRRIFLYRQEAILRQFAA